MLHKRATVARMKPKKLDLVQNNNLIQNEIRKICSINDSSKNSVNGIQKNNLNTHLLPKNSPK